MSDGLQIWGKVFRKSVIWYLKNFQSLNRGEARQEIKIGLCKVTVTVTATLNANAVATLTTI